MCWSSHNFATLRIVIVPRLHACYKIQIIGFQPNSNRNPTDQIMRELSLSMIIFAAAIPLSAAFSTNTRQLHHHAINALPSTEYNTSCDVFIKEEVGKKDVDTVLPTNQKLHHPRSKMRDTRPFPFGLIVDQQKIKLHFFYPQRTQNLSGLSSVEVMAPGSQY